ncbi:hypothetical protein QYF61_022342 [Mycteria americana]|uniref:Uncharacterized protein n=1 Tax=Mycteria americana TaxID=33587 RepID=A0AAN7N3X6_MYCAM|nr:hypothetical protein QYF61_022342 [Mycteria americana]
MSLHMEQSSTGTGSQAGCKSPSLETFKIQREPMPAGSKMDLPLAKAKPISNGGSASGMEYLGRGKNCCATAAGKEECEYVRGTTLQTPRSAEKDGEEVLQVPEQRFPCSPW